MNMSISKSKFVAGCQCLKRVYLQVHEPELAAEPDGTGNAVIEQGREIGMLARKLFPSGIEVDGSTGLKQAIRTTRQLIANPEIPAIFEGVGLAPCSAQSRLPSGFRRFVFFVSCSARPSPRHDIRGDGSPEAYLAVTPQRFLPHLSKLS